MREEISRRNLLACLGLMTIPPALTTSKVAVGTAHAATSSEGVNGPRVAALGWATAQSLLAIGAEPLLMPEIERYSRLVVEPPVPESVREAGLRSEPSLELLAQLQPDLIVIDPSLGGARARLERIAPVEVFDIRATETHSAYERSGLAIREIALRLGMEEACESYLARVEDTISAAVPGFAQYRGGPVYVVGELVRNAMLVFGGRCIYQDLLDRFGLQNAWTGPTSAWGHATVPLEVMAEVPEARLLLLSRQAADLKAMIEARPLTRRLPFVRDGRITVLDNMLFYGGVPTADRFTRLLVERLPLDKSGSGAATGEETGHG